MALLSSSSTTTITSSSSLSSSSIQYSVWTSSSSLEDYSTDTQTGTLGRRLSNNNIFLKTKDSQVFFLLFFFFFHKWNTKIQGSTMQPLKTSKPDLSGNSPQIYKCYSLVHLFSENLVIGQSSSKRCSLSVPTVTVLQFFWNIFLTIHLPWYHPCCCSVKCLLFFCWKKFTQVVQHLELCSIIQNRFQGINQSLDISKNCQAKI